MNLRLEQLSAHLQRQLASLYFISGDEPLQLSEAADAVRAKARDEGYSERVVMEVEAGFDWQQLLAEAAAPSLFAERRLLELRLPGGKPGREGGKVLEAYARACPPDTLLLVQSGKLDAKARKAKWYQALDRAGVVMVCYAPEARQLPGWIAHRMRALGMQPDKEAATLLAERVEGNLLAAAQEIEKLRLLLGEGAVTAEQVADVVADSARYSVFDLADAALAGDVQRVRRVLEGLRGEGVEPTLILWALAREIRLLTRLAGESDLEAGLRRQRVWSSRSKLYRQAVSRRKPAAWQRLLVRCAAHDRSLKGVGLHCRPSAAAPGCVWDEALDLALSMAGKQDYSLTAPPSSPAAVRTTQV